VLCDQLKNRLLFNVINFIFQVHARNILRALYKETKLGEDVFPYVADGVHVAVEGFLSEIWAVSCRHYHKI
jgi:hypothetical protein